MKKIVTAVVALLFMGTVAFAQDAKPAEKKKTSKAKTEKKAEKTETKKEEKKMDAKKK